VDARGAATPLVFGDVMQGELDCNAGRCRRWYRFALGAPGELRVDVEAPVGEGVPDFDVRLEDTAGDMLWGFAPTGHSPRQVRRLLGPGIYFLLVHGVGETKGPLHFELRAGLEAEAVVALGPPHADAGGRRPDPRPKRSPEIWLNAEIVQLEGRAGQPAFVVLDAGRRDDLTIGLSGELIEDGSVLAAFDLVEVEDASSRGRLRRPPSESVTYATRARIRLPLPTTR
jgi:hypothetical protein